MPKQMSKDERAAYQREYRERKKQEAQLEAKEKAESNDAFVMALTGNRAEVEMEDVEAVATMADEDERAVAEQALFTYMDRRYAKYRTWAFIIYPDSCPPDWEDKLRIRGVVAAGSPLHDRDVTKLLQPKKPHWHIIVDWPNGTTTFRTVAAISKGLLNGTLPIPLTSPRGYYRYLCHLDNPDKAQYDKSQIVHINGFDPSNFLDLTKAEKLQLRKELDMLIAEQNICEYGDLMTYVRTHCGDDAYDMAASNTMYFSAICRSRRHSSPKYNYKTGAELLYEQHGDGSCEVVGELDPETGEVVPTTM